MKKLKLFSLLMLLFVGVTSMWATAYISYNGSSQDASTTISSSNVGSGTAGKISWTGSSCTYSSSRVNIAANGYITFTANTGYNITKIVITSGSSSDFYGTWTSSPSVTASSSGGVTTFDGLNANSVRVTTSTAFRCTSASHIKIYYTQVVSNLSVKTAPTKVEYKKGETLDLTGLVLNADGNDVTSGYSASPANGDALNTVGAQTVTITYGGKTTTQTIYVGALTGIEITTPPTKTAYKQGQTFDPTGMVVKATFSDGEETPTSWKEEVDDYTYPTTGLAKGATSVTISYTSAGITETADQTISVEAATAYTVTFNAGSGTCGTASLTEPDGLAGVELPTATISVTGWSFAGWATAATANTEVEPTLYAAGSTYHPTEDCTLYAVYKFSEADGKYKRATSVSEITSASSVVVVSNKSTSKVMDTTFGNVNAPTETNSKINAPEQAIFTLTGDNTNGYTLTNGTTTVGAASTTNGSAVSNTTTNDLWVVKAHNTSNTFYLENKALADLSLEYYSGWKVYAPATPNENDYVAMKVYVPNFITVYNSNPAAIINPSIAFETAGNKNLYVQDENSYSNVANVTSIAKTPVYSSNDETVATVTDAGVVTVLKSGSVTITAKVEKEVGVNTEASVSYNVSVKDAKTIAGLKAITSTATVKSFTADLTDAVVTYVNGSHAYIQDASGAVYASCGSSLTAGKKINGAVNGSIKAANQIDEITAIDLSEATLTDGVIPSAAVLTAATLAANKADYEGKLVSIENATVTANQTTSSASGGKISDDSKVTEINLYAPNTNVEVLKDAEGTFNGYITLYSGSTIRFNIYEQSQITLTKNAPTNQTLTFAEDAVVLDHPSAAFNAFAGQTVSGNQTTPVVYSIDSDDDDVVTSIDDESGEIVLSGKAGTATIKVLAPAGETTTAGVTTPWKETSKTYTITVRQLYTVTWSVNGVETTQQALEGTTLTEEPTPGAITGKTFRFWSDAPIDGSTDSKPKEVELTTMPAKDTVLYAVYASAHSTSQVLEFSYTIVPGDLTNSGYEDNSTKTKTATCNTAGYTTETVTIQFKANQVMNNQSKIQGHKSDGIIYNESRWGKQVKSVTINGNTSSYFSSTIGTSANPTSAAEGAFFRVYVNSNNTAVATSIEIVFDSTITVTTYDAYITNAYKVTFEDPENGSLSVRVSGGLISSGAYGYKGETITIEATPDSNYTLASLNAVTTSGTTDIKESKSFTIGTEDVEIVAVFSKTTALEDVEDSVKAVKVLRNGVLYIEKSGRIYNAQGQLVK